MSTRIIPALAFLLCAAAGASGQALPDSTSNAAPDKPSVPHATGNGSPQVSFDFANPALTPAIWRVEIAAQGSAHYHSHPGEAGAPDATGALPLAFDQQIEISARVRKQIFAIAQTHRLFAVPCESRHKVAFTGSKTVAYRGPDGQGSCTFNWSQDPQMMKVAETFLAISTTLEEGRKLRLEYLHDRLSLDAELETLADAAKTGAAIELQNIAPELRAIASDGAVMKRAQARANALLASLPADTERASIQSH